MAAPFLEAARYRACASRRALHSQPLISLKYIAQLYRFPIHFPFFAASSSATRAPRRIVLIIVLPSWQAHSYTGPFVFVQGTSAVQELAHVAGSSTVNW